MEELFSFVDLVVSVFVPSEIRLDRHSEVLVACDLLERCVVEVYVDLLVWVECHGDCLGGVDQ